VVQLKGELRAAGLKVSGLKADLVRRLSEAKATGRGCGLYHILLLILNQKLQ